MAKAVVRRPSLGVFRSMFDPSMDGSPWRCPSDLRGSVPEFPL
jgi:hypothetical protein